MGLSRPLKFIMLMLFVAIGGLKISHAQVQSVFSDQFESSDLLFESKPGQLEVFWKARVYGESTALTSQSAEVAGADLFADGKYQLLKSTQASIFLRAKFEAGRSQSFFGDLEPGTGLLLREASIKQNVFSFLDVKAGVINQDWLNMPLLTFRQSFPGALVDLYFDKIENTKFGYIGQYAVPTSQTLSSRTVGREASPSFITHTLYGEYDVKKSYKISASLNTYEYKKLPSMVAFESFLTGNSADDDVICSQNNCEFEYAFRGWFATVGGSARWNQTFEPGIEYSLIKNQEAPETMNDGHLIRAYNRIHTDNYAFYIGYDRYFAESDVVPSYYNAWVYGKSNKEGQGGELAVEFKKKNFRVRFQYYEADLINFSDVQENQKSFWLGVETGYDKI